MINNRQGNRRRGRNNGARQNRGGDNGNRIDNRARGNAAQLLEKYKNLARDAQMQGDRVQTEYFLQFADHYFRVLNDVRQRQEEQQRQRQEERAVRGVADGVDLDDDSEDLRGQTQDGGYRDAANGSDDAAGGDSEDATMRDSQRRDRRPRRDNNDRRSMNGRRTYERSDDGAADGHSGLDASLLPPAIMPAPAPMKDEASNEAEETAAEPKRVRRPRTRKVEESAPEIAN